ncbi:MAG TPA: sulfite exporter TauE/SafE family protein, partial [Zeimonas sp.]
MPLDFIEIIVVAVAGFLAGAVNSVAGGGTFFSFPALLAVGVPPVIANASNAVALWPGSLAGAWAFRRELRRFAVSLPALSAIAFVGGIAGGLLLLRTSNERFSMLVPWLLLLATLLFAFSGPLSSGIRSLLRRARQQHERALENERSHERAAPMRQFGPGGYLFQGVVSIYGGFFGAGMGILMIASLAIQGFDDLHEINALKNWLSAVIYSVAVAT